MKKLQTTNIVPTEQNKAYCPIVSKSMSLNTRKTISKHSKSDLDVKQERGDLYGQSLMAKRFGKNNFN